MIDIANVEARSYGRPLHLGVAFQAQVHITLHQHLCVDGAVGGVAGRAPFAQRSVLKNEGPGLFPMTLGASLVLARHRQPASRVHDVHAVRVMALDTIHPALNYRVMLRQVEFGAGFLVAPEAGFRVFAGIDDEFFETAAPGHGDVFAARSMAGFAAGLTGHFGAF
jgi:hypothetical protein